MIINTTSKKFNLKRVKRTADDEYQQSMLNSRLSNLLKEGADETPPPIVCAGLKKVGGAFEISAPSPIVFVVEEVTGVGSS